MYSKDIIKLSNNLYKNIKNFRKVSAIVNIGKSTIQRWVSNLSYYLRKHKKQSRPSKINENISRLTENLVKENPFLRLKDIQKRIYVTFEIKISLQSISNILRRKKITYKRIHKRNYYKSIEDIKEKEKKFIKEIEKVPLKEMVSIDETSIYINDLPRKGWSLKGNKCIVESPLKLKKKVLLLAISNNKIINYLITEKNINSNIYLDFIKESKINNKVIICDNVPFHKTKHVVNEIEKKNKLIFIPPYSPEYNPIEMVFSQIKRNLRFRFSKMDEDLESNLISEIENVSEEQLDRYFQHTFTNFV